MTRGKSWTPQEVKTLKKCAGKMPIAAIAEMVGRTRESTRTKAIRLRIPLAQYGERHPLAKHSNETVEIARRMRDRGAGMEHIASALGIKMKTLEGWIYFRGRINDPVVLQ